MEIKLLLSGRILIGDFSLTFCSLYISLKIQRIEIENGDQNYKEDF